MDIKTNLKEGNIAVLGGNGFIGRHLVKHLLSLNYEITIIDRYQNCREKNVNFILGDIRNHKLVKKTLSNCDGVINLAGILGTSETINNPRETLDTNFRGALNVFEAVKFFHIPCVQITVGNFWMNNPYAITKHAAEKFALHFNEVHGTKISVVRGLNAYGEGQKQFPVKKLMPNLIIPALRNDDIHIFGNGNQVMDMIYVEDLIRVLVKALILDHQNWDKIIEAGSGQKTTVNDICSEVLRITKSNSNVIHDKMRGGEPENAVVLGNTETLKCLDIDVNNFTSLYDGINKTVKYYKNSID